MSLYLFLHWTEWTALWVAGGLPFVFGGFILALLFQSEKRQATVVPDIEDEIALWEDLKEAAEEFLRDQCRHNRHQVERALEALEEAGVAS